MIRRILIYDPLKGQGPKILRQKSRLVVDFNSSSFKNTLVDLNDTLDDLIKKYGCKRGIGISASQIGSNSSVSIIKLGLKKYFLINPVIIKKSAKKRLFRIGCFSLYKYRGLVRYPEQVTVEYFNKNKIRRTLRVSGDFALIVQHEIDHQNGILIFDRLPDKEKGLFVPREHIYLTSHVPLKNYAFMIMLKRKLGINFIKQSTTQYYSLLFNNSVDYKNYMEKAVTRRKELVNLIREEVPENGNILESGCGTSAISIHLSLIGYKLKCIDINRDMLDLAMRFNKNLRAKVKYHQENFMSIKNRNDSFNLVYSHGVLEHFNESEIVQAINEGLRVSPKYIVSVPTVFDVSNNLMGDENLWTRWKWKKIISKSNGKICKCLGSFPFNSKLAYLNDKLDGKLKIFAPVLIFLIERKK